MKTILHLGGAPSQVPAIKYAVEAGYRVITCDYSPENPGHKFSHQYYNVSTTNRDEILKLAEILEIDAIVSYASDPAAPVVGYVAEKLNLVGPGRKAAELLANKGFFRKAMIDCGLSTPGYKLFREPDLALDYLKSIAGHSIVKPVDSSGSKGVHTLKSKGNEHTIIQNAFKYSLSKEIIIEELIETHTTQVQGEAFVINGQLKFAIFGDQKFSAYNINAPASTSFPSKHSQVVQKRFVEMIQKVIGHCGFLNGGLNIEILEDLEGRFHLIEIGPRNGGNFMPQLVKRSCGIDLVQLSIEMAVGNKPELKMDFNIKPCSQLILHSGIKGILKSIDYLDNLKDHIAEEYLFKKEGDSINVYGGSQDVIGVCIVDIPRFGGEDDRILNISEWINLVFK